MEATSRTDALDPAFVQEWSNRYMEAWDALDADGVAAVCTEDVVWFDPGLPEPTRGREAVREFVRATAQAFPDFQVEELGSPYIATDEPRVLARYRMTGTMLGNWPHGPIAATGRPFSVLGVDEWTFRGELMCNYHTYYDSLDMARQFGVLPPPQSSAAKAMARVQSVQARFQRRAGR